MDVREIVEREKESKRERERKRNDELRAEMGIESIADVVKKKQAPLVRARE